MKINFLIFLVLFLISFHSIDCYSYTYDDITNKMFTVDYSDKEDIPANSLFKNNNENEFNRNYSKKYLWLKYHATNKDIGRYLVLTSPLLTKINLFSKVAAETTAFNSAYRILRILEPGQLYIRIKTRHHVKFSVLLMSENDLYHFTIEKTYIYIAYLGAVLVLILVNLLLSSLTKDKMYLLYSLFAFSFLILILNLNGILGHAFTNYLFICSSGTLLLSLYFTYSYFDIFNNKLLHKLYIYLFTWIFVLATAYLVKGHMYYNVLGELIDGSIGVGCLLILFSSIKYEMKKPASERFYLYSWLIIISTIIVYFLHRSNSSQYDFFGDYSLVVGNIGTLIFISMSLALNIKVLEKQNIVEKLKARNAHRYQRLVRVLVHDIANPLSIIAPVLKRIKDSDNEEKKSQYFSKATFALDNINGILKNVRSAEKDQNAVLDIKAYELHELVNKSLIMFEERAKFKNIKFNKCFVKNKLMINIDQIIFINNILNNIISNSIKFSNKNDTIDIETKLIKDNVSLIIRDYGEGISKDDLEVLKNKGTISSKIGTLGEVGTGFGMQLMIEYTEVFNGKISIYNTNNDDLSGTTVQLSFPRAI